MRDRAHTRRPPLAGAILLASTFLLIRPVCAQVATAPAKPFTFVQVCDPQLGMTDYKEDIASFEQAVKQINLLHPDFVLICGDFVHKPNATSLSDFSQIRHALAVPSHLAPGNHDVGTKPDPESLRQYRERFGPDYYALEHKQCTFIVVNTQLWKKPVAGESERQDAWLREELRAARDRGQRIIVVGHYALFCERPDEPEKYQNLPPLKRKELLDLYEDSGVSAVIGGHTHKLTMHDYRGILLVNGEALSLNIDNRPRGFRLWEVPPSGPCTNRFIHLYRREQIDPKPPYDPTREAGEAALCLGNLRALDLAKEAAGMQQGLANGEPVRPEGLASHLPAGREALKCPLGGRYQPNPLGQDPTCTIPGHALPYFYQFEEFQRRAAEAALTPSTRP